jgi:hypothetical protein
MSVVLSYALATEQLTQQPPILLNIIDLVPSIALICVDAVTFDLLRSAQTHQIHETAYKHLQNSC